MTAQHRTALRVVAALVVVATLDVARASRESSLWMDETASLVLANQPAAFTVDVSAVDFNPPGYFLLLGRWLALARAAGLEPGVLAARSLGIVCWCGLVALAWLAGRRLLAGDGGPLLALAVGGGASAASLATEARAYGVASVALFACFVALLRLHAGARAAAAQTSPRWRRAAGLWTLYAASGAVALWTHLLSLFVLASLALFWLGLASRLARPARPSFLVLGAAAHVAALLAFLPWLLQVRGQLDALRASAPSWMTPATLFNLASVFWYWVPFGRVGTPRPAPSPWFPLLGALSLMLPVGAAIGARLRRGPREGRRPATLVAAAGLAVPATFIALLWAIQRAGVAAVFHAPRYPALAAPMWAAGLVAAARAAASGGDRGDGSAAPGAPLGGRSWWPWALLAPWLACAALGQALAWRVEGRGGLGAGLATLAEAPPPRASLYVMPSELLPFQRHALAGYAVRPIEDLPCGLRELRDGDDAWVLSLDRPWPLFDRTRDLIAARLLAGGALARRVERRAFPQPSQEYELLHLRGVRHDASVSLCRDGLRPRGRDISPGAVAVALPEAQRYADGWSYPEVNEQLVVYRWASTRVAVVRFDRPLAAGDYVLHYRGYRTSAPRDPERMTFTLGDVSRVVAAPAGDIVVDLQIHLASALRHPLLSVAHPTWVAASTSASGRRRLASALLFATLERAR